MGSKIARTKKVTAPVKPSTTTSSTSAFTSSTPPQKQQGNRTWVQVAINTEPTKEQPAKSATRQPLDNNITQSHGASTLPTPKTTLTEIEKPAAIGNAILRRVLPHVRNSSASTISTNATLDSKESTDSNKVTSNSSAKPTTLPSDCSDGDEKPRYYKLVNDEKSLHEFLSVIDQVEDFAVDLFADAEGSNQHGRHHKLNAIPLKMVSKDRRWLLDPIALGDRLWNTPSRTGKKRTLKEIFENEIIPMVWFDVRSDADSHYGNFKVRLGGVIDLQIMEMATRNARPLYRHGLDRCIRSIPADNLPAGIKESWENVKYVGKRMCSGPERYGIFDRRPLPRELEEYAINDVELMPELFTYYSVDKKLCENEDLMRLVLKLSKQAVDESIAPDYEGNNSSSKYGPSELTDRWGPYNPYDSDYDYY